MYCVQTRKEKNLVFVVPSLINNPDLIQFTKTNFFDGREHCPRYDEIYRVFHNEYLPFYDKEIDAISKSGIHTLATCPMLFPYNDIAWWCFKQLEKGTTTIINESKVIIASLNP